MSFLKRLDEKLCKRLPLLVLILFVVQAPLDVAGYWQVQLHLSNTITLAIRMVLLGGSVLLGFLLSGRKRYYVITGAVLVVLTGLHAYACMQNPNGYVDPITDIVNLVRIYFLPMMTLCFITFLKRNEKVFSAMKLAAVIDLCIIALIQFLSWATGTDPNTYSADSVGVRGWFIWTNSQSAILSMIGPIVICWTLQRWKDKALPAALATAISEATLWLLAPRLAYASLIAIGFGMVICLLIIDRKRWRQVLAVALVTVAFIAVFPISPTHQRLEANAVRAEETEERIDEMEIEIETEVVEEEEKGEKTTKKKVKLSKKTKKKLEKLYRSQHIIWSMVERFGRDRVFEAYNYTLDPTILSNTRLMKITFCELLMDESGLASRLFGLNLSEMAYERQDKKGKVTRDNYDVENDLHGMYFLTGIVGLVLMGVFLLYFGVYALIAVIRKPKVYFNLEMCAFAGAYVLSLIHAYFTASVLRRNNASIYLAMVLAGLWYLARRKAEEKASAPAEEASALTEEIPALAEEA